MRMQGCASWDQQYDGGAQIKGRGNSTWNYAKKPYKVKLDSSTNLFGMGKSKHWVLLANFLDPSLVRNTVAQDIGREAGLVTMSSVWVDVVLNGNPVGNYQLCEQVRVGKTRVDVFNWDDLAEDLADAFYDERKSDGMTKEQATELEDALDSDFTWVTSGTFEWNGATWPVDAYIERPSDVSGGYLFELSDEYDEASKFMTQSGLKVMVSKPEYAFKNAAMEAYCESMWGSWEKAARSEDSYDGGTWIGDIADVESMASYWLCMEIMGNSDAVYKSRFAYKDFEGKLMFGPLWDFDWGCAAPVVGWTNGDGWKLVRGDNNQNFYKELLDDPYLVMLSGARYWSMRPFLQSLVDGEGALDSYAATLAMSGEANDALWGEGLKALLGKAKYRTFAQDSAVFKTYLGDRLVWLDAQFASLDAALASLKTTSAHPYEKSDKVSLEVQGASAGVPGAAGVGSDAAMTALHDVPVVINASASLSAASADLYVNGRKAGSVAFEDGAGKVVVAKSALSEAAGRPDLISVICRDSAGASVATSYTTLSTTVLYTRDEVDAAVDAAVKEAVADLVTTEESEAAIRDAVEAAIEGLSTKEEVDAAVASAVEAATEGLSTKDEVDAAVASAVEAAIEGLSTKEEVDAAVASAVGAATEGLSTKEEVDSAVASAVASATEGLYTKDQVDGKVASAVGEATASMYTKSQVDDAVSKSSSELSASTNAALADIYDELAVERAAGKAPGKKTYKATKKTGVMAKKHSFLLKAVKSQSGKVVAFSKAGKSGGKRITVSKKGKVSVKKGLKRGSYKLKVRVACGNYSEKVAVRIVVK